MLRKHRRLAVVLAWWYYVVQAPNGFYVKEGGWDGPYPALDVCEAARLGLTAAEPNDWRTWPCEEREAPPTDEDAP